MFVDRLMSQTADENIPSSVGMFHCSILVSFSFSFIFVLHFVFISAVILYTPLSTPSCSTPEIVFSTTRDYRHKVVITMLC